MRRIFPISPPSARFPGCPIQRPRTGKTGWDTSHLLLRHDGKTVEGDYIFGSICNCDSLACTFPLPKELVAYDDGLFETILIRSPRSVAELQTIVTALRNQDYDCPLIDFFRSGRIFIENAADLSWTVDGELAPTASEILVENRPRALRILC